MNILRYKTRKLLSMIICFMMVLSMFTGMGSFALADESLNPQDEFISEQRADAEDQLSIEDENDGNRVLKSFTISGNGKSEKLSKSYSLESTTNSDSSAIGGGGSIDEDYPQMVKTVADVVYEENPISIISADMYYGNKFYLQFTGLAEQGDYQVTLTGEGFDEDGLVEEIIGNSVDENLSVDEPVRGLLFTIPEDAIEDGESKVINVQVSDWNDNALFSQPAEITTKFIIEVGEVYDYHVYYGKNVRELKLGAFIPANIDPDTKVNAYLLDANDNVVAADAQKYFDFEEIFIEDDSEPIDDRYFDVFGNFGYDDDPDRTISFYGTSLNNIHLYKMSSMPAGQYSLKIVTKESETYIIPESITVVDGTIITGIYANYVDQYPPASIGGNLLYVEVDFEDALKDDLNVVLKDDRDQVIGTTVSSKYNHSYDGEFCAVYKLQLTSTTFQENEEYYVEITRKDNGPIYYNEEENSDELSATNDFSIYRHMFNNGLDADFTFKSVNADGSSYRLTLLEYYDEDELSQVTINPTSDTFQVKFYDEENNIIQLEPDNDYEILIEAEIDNEFELVDWHWFDTYDFEDMDDTYIPDILLHDMKPYLKETSEVFNFDFCISVDSFNVDENGQFEVELWLPNKAEPIVVNGNAVTASIEQEVVGEDGNEVMKDYVRLTGSMPIEEDPEEGVGYIGLKYTTRDNESKYCEDIFNISIINPEKVYATYLGTNNAGYPVFRVWMDLLNENYTFDNSKFTFILEDLLGNVQFNGNLELDWESDQESTDPILYKDFVISVPDDLAKGYYAVSVKYDGKDIYNFYKPDQLILANRDNILEFIPDHPEIGSWWIDDNGKLIGIEVAGAPADAVISAKLYDESDLDNFDAIKTITLVKGNNERNVYYFTEEALQGLDLSKTYQIVYLCDNVIMEINDYWKVNFESTTPSQNITAPFVSVTSNFVKSNNITLNIPAWNSDSRITGVRVAESAGALSTAQIIPIAEEIPYTLSNGDGQKTLYIGFTAQEGYTVIPAYRTLTVTLDSIAPAKPTVASSDLLIVAGTTAGLAATGIEGGLIANVQFVDQNNKVLKDVLLTEGPAPVDGLYTYAADVTFTKTIMNATKAVFTFTDKAGNKSEATEIPVSAIAGVDVTAKLMYDQTTPAANVGVSLYKVSGSLINTNEFSGGTGGGGSGGWGSSTYLDYAISDAEGIISFQALAPGEYLINAYPGNAYENMNEEFIVVLPTNVNEKTLDLGEILFHSRYPNRAELTVNVTKNSAPVNDAYVSISNYELGIYETQQSGTNGAYTFANLPYTADGTDYDIYVSTSAYYDYFRQTINEDVETKEFQVPEIYSVSGHVYKGDAPISDVFVMAKNKDNHYTYYGYVNDQGEYTINGVIPGSYDLCIDSYSKYRAESQVIEVADQDLTDVNISVSTGLTVVGKVIKGSSPAYKASVSLVKKSDHGYIASGYATGNGGYVFDGAIKEAGEYILTVDYICDAFGRWIDFVCEPVEFTVTDQDLLTPDNRITKDITYADPTNPAAAFVGAGNTVTSDISVVRNGSSANLIVKYKNNSGAAVSPIFKVALPAGITTTEEVNIAVGSVESGATGQISLPLTIGNTENYFSIPVKVSIDSQNYDFGVANFEVSKVSLSGPGAVKVNEDFILYGEATNNSVVIKNAITGDVLAAATPNGRWYSVKLKLASEGVYKLVAESDGTLSKILTIEAKADQIILDKVHFNSQDAVDLPINSLIGVRATTAWVGPDLKGRDINIGSEFINGSLISKVTYHFSGKDYTATKNANGVWAAILNDWGGAGLKTITATIETTDGRILEFIIVEVTVLVDPSGYVYDKETNAPIEGVKVICEELKNEALDEWQKWDAEKFGQINPQLTDAEGKYGWMVPNGTYRVVAQMNGYQFYVTTGDNTIAPIEIPPVRTDVNIGLEPNIRVTKITINKTATTIQAGNNETLTAIAEPFDATNANNLTWKSSNENVATVDSTGKVTAIAKGTANITANVGNTSTEACEVTVIGSSSGNNGGGGGGGATTVVSKPVINPQGGAVEKGTKVTITSATAEAKIYYTTDGTKPTASSKLYKAPIEITQDTVIKAIGVKSGYTNSDIATASYTIKTAEAKPSSGTFTDIAKYGWAKEAIESLAGKDIIKGISDKEFAPSAQIKRADYIALIVRMLGLTADVKDNFNDVSVNKYYYNDIGIAKALGLTTGVGGNNFDPEVSITRQDMFVLACRIMMQQGIITTEANLDVLNQFIDNSQIADYGKNELAILVSMNLINGNNSRINPKGNATRAETAVFIYRLADLLNK